MLGLLALPALWWLLRAVPPAPRRQAFPALRLLEGLAARRQETRRAPVWLLLLRVLAAILLIAGLAQPVLVQHQGARPGSGSLLVVLDNGWAAATDWPQRIAALDAVLDQAGRDRRQARLVTTALASPGGADPLPASQVRAAVDAMRPTPWNTDRAHAALPAAAVGQVVYVSDGLASPGDPAGDARFAQALRRLGPVTELRAGPQALRLLLAPEPRPNRLVVHVGALPQPVPRSFTVRAEDAQGGVLARVEGHIPAGVAAGRAELVLPVELRNRIARLELDGVPGTGGLRLLDEGDRRRPVGLIGGGGFSDTPLIGPLFYLERALSPDTELRTGDVNTLLSRQLAVLVAPDGTLDDPATRARVAGWVRGGGMLVRFAGPRLASQQQEPDQDPQQVAPDAGDAPDPASPSPGAGADSLLPAPLLGGSRTLGGAMSWSHPATLAPFAPDSVFAGLAVPADVSVTRQVLARPASDLDRHSWAKLSDGTPLVTHAPLGAGQVVLFHVTATGDWSSLPFSGLFVQMLHRLMERSVGQLAQSGDAMLAPFATFDGDGVLGTPPPSAIGVSAREIGHVAASAAHPPGLYGPRSDRRALNAGDGLPPLAASPPIGTLSDLAGRVPDRPLGPWLLAAGLLLLALDLLVTLRLRGLLRPGSLRAVGAAGSAALLVLLCVAGSPAAADRVPAAAEETRLGYVLTGDAHTDLVSRQGLEGLSSYVNARTSAVLGHPDAVQPGHDDLSFYPLLYWPVTTGARPDPAAIAALNGYMSHGGILLIDTQEDAEPGDPSDPGNSTDGARALRQATGGLDIPPLAQVATGHVLAHSFYLLHAFPGRTVGAPVWVAAGADQGNDNVSPVIIGANDWAAAWAVNDAGDTPYAVIPDGDAQRTMAYRFGVNAVIYALTGNYKADQVHVPALLQRLGE